MDRYRLSLIVIGVLAVAILFGGWAVGVQPQLDRMSAADTQTASIRQLNTVQENRNAALAADNEKLGDYKAQLAADQAEIPASRSQQDLIDQLNAVATSAGASITSLTFAAATAYAAPDGVPVVLPTSQTLVAVPVTITATAARASLEAFVAALQASARIISVTTSQYTGPDESAVTLTGTTWVMQAPAS